jgi:hypothetical protein
MKRRRRGQRGEDQQHAAGTDPAVRLNLAVIARSIEAGASHEPSPAGMAASGHHR